MTRVSKKDDSSLVFAPPISVRMFPRVRRRVLVIVRRDGGDRFDNESHFYRVAVLKLLREEEAKLLEVRR